MQTRNTLQKEIILKAVNKLHNHPTAEMVYKEVIRDYPRVSKATVYRNLNQMSEQAIIMRIRVPGTADRYDFQTHNHYHLKCKLCDRIFDIDVPYMDMLDQINLKSQGFEVENHTIIFEGICPHCSKKSTN